jgi:hypothetical protein
MADPTSGAASKVAEEMLKEVQEAMKQSDQIAQTQQTPEVQFNQVLEGQQVNQVQEVRPGNDSTNVLRAGIQAQQAPAVPAIGQAIDSPNPIASGIQRVFTDVMSGQNKLEEIIGLAISGRSFSTSELLALQAGVYRFTQELELTSKVIEKGTSSIKQTLNTQV